MTKINWSAINRGGEVGVYAPYVPCPIVTKLCWASLSDALDKIDSKEVGVEFPGSLMFW